MQFKGDRGTAFFRSTLVQTLFYGVFSAWVIWARKTPSPAEAFNWHETGWLLRVPVLRALFQQLSDPGQLRPLGLDEVLDWTAAALNRVDRVAFFDKFSEGEAVPYFYEPFLEAFDPDLRKQLGVWYTPPEVVRYMVARVDRALKDDLGIEDGLAAENVYILDPCCGTGAYLAEALRRIAENLESKGYGASIGAHVKKAATERVFGFEIMPAPFVVAHLQVGLTMQSLDAPLADDGTERAGVFLTNALTGWEPKVQKPLPFPELEEERDRANRVKQDTPVLVILGNPPYNGFAETAEDEERKLSTAYQKTKRVRRPEGPGLNDPFVRFFRMAERRIVEKTGQGVVCFISNYSWLDGLSFTGMRERYLEAFDVIRIDNLHGDIRRGGKTPDGQADESVFTVRGSSPGIRVGTAISTLVRKAAHTPVTTIGVRDLWGEDKHEELMAAAESVPEEVYESLEPNLTLGLPFARITMEEAWSDWPALPDLFPQSFPGVKTSRDSLLVDVDLDRLKARMMDFFDSAGMPRPNPDAGFIHYAYRPYDTRWLYWEADSGLLDRPRSNYKPHVLQGNLWLVTPQKQRREWSPPPVASAMGDINHMDGSTSYIPVWVRDAMLGTHDIAGSPARPNLTHEAQSYLDKLGMSVEDLFHHALAVLHDPAYRQVNAGALRMEWPRIPLPGWPDGDADGAADKLAASAARGRDLAALLDSETPVPGVTTGVLRREIAAIAVPSTVEGRNMSGDDFSLTAGWGHLGQGEAVMPGQGRLVDRPYTNWELAAMGDVAEKLGGTTVQAQRADENQTGDAAETPEDKTVDVYLNDQAYWRNIPAAVWNYKLGGYQVLKKWLSYREHRILGRPLTSDEVRHFSETARRIGGILGMGARPDEGS